MIESNKELEQIKSEMEEIRKMLGEIKENTAYFKGFMEKYNIPMQEEEKKDISVLPEVKTGKSSFTEIMIVPNFGTIHQI